MPINVLMCRWVGGWREVRNEASIATYGRREAFLSLGALQSPQEVDRVAGEQLAIFADPRTAIAADIEPMGIADRPYRAWNVGDTIQVPAYGGGVIGERVRSLTGAEDDNGEITYSPELGDLILETQERHELALKKMADGTLEGESPVATPVAQTQQAQKVYGGAPFPTGFVISTAADTIGHNYWGFSESLPATPDGIVDHKLLAFAVTVPYGNWVDGPRTTFEVVTWIGDGGDTVLADVDLGLYHEAGTYTGTVRQSAATIGAGSNLQFHGSGQFSGPFRVTATFAGTGPEIQLTWIEGGLA